MEGIHTETHLRLFTLIAVKKHQKMFVQSVSYLSLLPVADVPPHSAPVVDYRREALSSECPIQHHTVGLSTTSTEWGAYVRDVHACACIVPPFSVLTQYWTDFDTFLSLAKNVDTKRSTIRTKVEGWSFPRSLIALFPCSFWWHFRTLCLLMTHRALSCTFFE